MFNMNMLTRWIKDAQEINVAEKGVSYSEEAFTQLYEEALKLEANHKIELKLATGKGAIIGAAGVGLVALSIKGINKFRKNRQLNIDKSGNPIKVPERFTNSRNEVMEIGEDGKVKKLSRKDKDELSEIINEVIENKRVH
jgi:phosphopantothenoylcysteine synthetase/decarboxylase